MITLLPYPTFFESINCLHDRQLKGQRRGAWLIYKELENLHSRWAVDPAVRMWQGYEEALACYYNWTLEIWASRGNKNGALTHLKVPETFKLPHWLGDRLLHESHQSILIQKNKTHYSAYFDNIPDNLPFVYPDQCEFLSY